MPSHLKDKIAANSEFQLPSFVSLNDVEGNQWADDLAGQSATYEELPLNITTPYLYHKNLTKRIQKRLAVILCALPNRPKHIPKAKIPNVNFDECCNLSRHVIYDADSKHIGCARCRQVHNRAAVGVRHWLASDCQPREPSWDRPIPIYGEYVQIGTLNIHISHKVFSYKNLYYCINCGSYATHKIRKLAHSCRSRTEAGQLFLDNLNKGILPPNVYSHPEQVALANINKYIANNTIAISPIASASSSEADIEEQQASSPVIELSDSD